MPSGKFLAQANAVLDEWFGSDTPTVPATWYVALFTVAPNRSGGGTEVTGGSYARVPIDNDLVTWAVAASGRKLNAIEFTFPQATANWGTVVSVALVNTSSGAYTKGVFGSLTLSVVIILGQTRYFPVGAFELIES